MQPAPSAFGDRPSAAPAAAAAMSAADSRSDRRRRRDDEKMEGHNQKAAELAQAGPRPSQQAVGAAADASSADSSATSQPPQQSAGVQPLPEQIGKRPRLSCGLHSLADVELQLMLQFLDTDSKMKAARCSHQLLQAANTPFAWRSAPPFVLTAQSAADVERIQTSLVHFAPIHLRCIGLESQDCVTDIPYLVRSNAQRSICRSCCSTPTWRACRRCDWASMYLLV